MRATRRQGWGLGGTLASRPTSKPGVAPPPPPSQTEDHVVQLRAASPAAPHPPLPPRLPRPPPARAPAMAPPPPPTAGTTASRRVRHGSPPPGAHAQVARAEEARALLQLWHHRSWLTRNVAEARCQRLSPAPPSTPSTSPQSSTMLDPPASVPKLRSPRLRFFPVSRGGLDESTEASLVSPPAGPAGVRMLTPGRSVKTSSTASLRSSRRPL